MGNEEKITIERVRLLYDYASSAIPFNGFLAVVASLYLFSQISFIQLTLFFSSILIITLLRYISAKKIIQAANWAQDYKKYLNVFIVGCLLQGFLWAFWYLILLKYLTIPGQFFMLLLLSGLASGSMSTMSCVSSAFYAYILPLLVLPTLWYYSHMDFQSLPIAVILTLYIAGISLSQMRTYRFIRDGIKLKFKNEALINDLKLSNSELERSNKYVKEISLTDELTQLANRRYFMSVLQREWFRNQRTSTQLAIIMIDIDYFKNYNDILGHQAGDLCLKKIAKVIKDNIKRSGDLAARYGGEEFICILPNTDIQGAATVAAYIQQSTLSKKIQHPNSLCSDYVTLSIGIASIIPSNESNPDKLIAEADKMLYKAKIQGRNRVVYQ